jgi:hypothetical protein
VEGVRKEGSLPVGVHGAREDPEAERHNVRHGAVDLLAPVPKGVDTRRELEDDVAR